MGKIGRRESTIGNIYGNIQVLSLCGETGDLVHARCLTCGRECDVSAWNVLSGRTTQCAQCGRKSGAKTITKYHSMEQPHKRRWLCRLYSAISRCHDERDPAYEWYGARGIKVYKEWMENKDSFLEYMRGIDHWDDPRYEIDRIDNNGGYVPGNIRCVMGRDNKRNTSRNRLVSYDGRSMCVTDFWSQYCPQYRSAGIVSKLLKRGVSPEEIVESMSERIRGKYNKIHHVEKVFYRGEELSVDEFWKKYVPWYKKKSNIQYRLDKGQSPEYIVENQKNDKIENVYDLLNCGDKNRFTIYTVCGPRIVHNCGYGGGYGAFLRFGADRMGIDEEEGKKIIAAWRDGHPMTVKLWHKLVEAAVMAMTNKGGIYSYRGISFQYYKRFLLMKLPSGRFLFYFEPKLEDVEMAWSTPEKPAFKKLVTAMTLTPEKQFVRRPLNHLIISENCTQAFCRDLMVNAMFNLEEANYPVVFHVHDEIIAEVPKGFGSVEEFENIMCKLPQWADGLPVKAEGWRGEFYRK